MIGDGEKICRLERCLKASQEIEGIWSGYDGLLKYIGIEETNEIRKAVSADGYITAINSVESDNGESRLYISVESDEQPCLKALHLFLHYLGLDDLDMTYFAEGYDDEYDPAVFTNDKSLEGHWEVIAIGQEKLPAPLDAVEREMFSDDILNRLLSKVLGKKGDTNDLAEEFRSQYTFAEITPVVYAEPEEWC